MVRRLLFIVCTCLLPAAGVLGQTARPAESPSHRVIPRTGGRPPQLADILPDDLQRAYQQIQAAEAIAQAYERSRRQAPEVTPQFRSFSTPDGLPGDAGELVRQASENLGRSLVEALNTDISEFAEQANRQLAENLGPRFAPIAPPLEDLGGGDVQFDPQVDLDRNLNQLRQELLEHQDKIRELVREYQQNWPRESLPPQEWIRKVQPFINQELITKLAEAAKELGAQPRSASSVRPKRDTPLLGVTPSTPARESEQHSSKVVGSMIKALDSQSTKLIKSAASRKAEQRQSWWKALQRRSTAKLKSFNRQLTDHSNRARERRYALPTFVRPLTGPSSTSAGNGFSSNLLLPAVGIAALAALLWWLREARRAEQARARWRIDPPDPGSVHDAGSLLAAFHRLSLWLFGRPSRYWNHAQFFHRLQQQGRFDRESLQAVRDVYERARYSRQSQLTDDEVIRAQRYLRGAVGQDAGSP